jgi:hypothetical protein
MAEGEGFEPPVPFRVQRFSRPPVSTAHASLLERLPASLQHGSGCAVSPALQRRCGAHEEHGNGHVTPRVKMHFSRGIRITAFFLVYPNSGRSLWSQLRAAEKTTMKGKCHGSTTERRHQNRQLWAFITRSGRCRPVLQVFECFVE